MLCFKCHEPDEAKFKLFFLAQASGHVGYGGYGWYSGYGREGGGGYSGYSKEGEGERVLCRACPLYATIVGRLSQNSGLLGSLVGKDSRIPKT